MLSEIGLMVEGKKSAHSFGVVLAVIGIVFLFVNAIEYVGGFFGLSRQFKVWD